MKNLFDKDCYDEISHRLNALTPASQRQWKMDAQMLTLQSCFYRTAKDKKIPQLLGLGWMDGKENCIMIRRGKKSAYSPQ
jgi:hypothetical protein